MSSYETGGTKSQRDTEEEGNSPEAATEGTGEGKGFDTAHAVRRDGGDTFCRGAWTCFYRKEELLYTVKKWLEEGTEGSAQTINTTPETKFGARCCVSRKRCGIGTDCCWRRISCDTWCVF